MNAERRIREAIAPAMEAARLSGVAAAARLPGGASVEIALGARGADNPAAMTPDTEFWVASCTKAVTAMAALTLVETGAIDLDEPVGRCLPGLARPRLLKGFDSDGQPQLVPATEPVTLRRLLTHTSGLGYGFTSAELDRYIAHAGVRFSGPEAPDLPLMFEPGKGWLYGVGLDWAGNLIEAVSGEPFDQYLRAHVLDPLGMHDTGFFPGDEQCARLASMHARTPDGGVTPIPFARPDKPSFMMGGGGLYSTPRDYLKFLDSVLGMGPQILKPEGLAALVKVETEGDQVGVLRSVQPNTSNDFDPFPGARKAWTLGFASNLEPGPHGRSAGSLAWAGLGNCYYWIDRNAGAAGIFCAQLLPFADPGALAMFAAFERAVYAG